VGVTAARVPDRDGGPLVRKRVDLRFPRWSRIGAEGADQPLVAWARWTGLAVREIVPRTSPGFEVPPTRGIVERTFAWRGRDRRLSKDSERRTETSEAVIQVAMVHWRLRRLGRT
jgi:putative transposase